MSAVNFVSGRDWLGIKPEDCLEPGDPPASPRSFSLAPLNSIPSWPTPGPTDPRNLDWYASGPALSGRAESVFLAVNILFSPGRFGNL